MSAREDVFDPWQHQEPLHAAAPNPSAGITKIADVAPLDDQFGAARLKSIPDALYPALFGPLKESKDSIDEIGAKERPQNAPSYTYALLDAAKIPNLVEMLFTSGLEHRCLFKGAAFEELKDVAPWIVRLEDDHRFTRQLFTKGQVPWNLWDKEPGVYLRSNASLDELWAHFRKFTRVQDEDGKWFVAKFWNGVLWAAFTRNAALMDLPLFYALSAGVERFVYTNDAPDQWFVIEPTRGQNAGRLKPCITRDLVLACNEIVELRHETADINHAIVALMGDKSAAKIPRKTYADVRKWLIHNGFRDAEHIRAALTTLAQRGMLVDKNWNAELHAMLCDSARGPGVRLWMLQNRQWD
jgi:hypothetical protein